MLDKTWAAGINSTEQPRCQTVVDFIYWPVLVSLNNWNIIQFTNKTTSIDDFYEEHQVVIHVISENMSSLVHTGKYVAINAAG